MIATVQQMRDAEARAMAAGQSEEALMEAAGHSIAHVVSEIYPHHRQFRLFCGKGHNAGDAFVAARHWIAQGAKVAVEFAFPVEELRPLAAAKWQEISSKVSQALEPGPTVLVDGLVGIGAVGELNETLSTSVHRLNELRRSLGAGVVALDVPSGLNADSGLPGKSCVVADLTVTVGMVKEGLLKPEALNHVGRLAVAPVDGLEQGGRAGERLLTPSVLRPVLLRRPFDFHKGAAGRVGIIAGSAGLLGAARLCAEGALRGGAGLVTLFVPEGLYPLLAPSVTPEVMVRPIGSYEEAWRASVDVMAIGPGLGAMTDFAREIQNFILTDPRPAVLDADALNLLANKGTSGLARAKAPRLVTPHPGEMKRLLDSWKSELAGKSRVEIAQAFSAAFPAATLLYKGSRTLIAAHGQPLSHNSTGHPGMASGGMGDVLTGICAALIGQGYSTYDAACVGSWVLGRSAELALAHGHQSAESLAATSVLAHLGQAFNALRTGVA